MVGLAENRDEKILLDLLAKNKFLKLDQGKIKCADLLELEKLANYYKKKTQMENKLQNRMN
jgi:CRP/FNR family transcriptional regulator